MAIAERSATTTWEGSLARGKGNVEAKTGAFSLPVTWASRTEAPDGLSSPEELAAAAHSSCYSMALSSALGKAGNPPDTLNVTALVTLDEVDGKPTVVTSHLTVKGKVPGIAADDFERLVHEAAAGCPISRLFAGAKISVTAELEAS